ncbi:MAG TPA: ABC transporter permease [Capsulimonadaceae bacterium]|jgi:ABC-type dipeptide/oligopeptide/nickel transport system permease component
MLRFILHRCLLALVSVWAIATITFFLAFLAPGDPAQLRYDHNVSPAAMAQWRHEHGLDLAPLPRYFRYLGGLMHGDMGRPYYSDAAPPVLQYVMQRFPNTALLATVAMCLALLVGLTVGIAASLRPNTLLDRTLMVLILAGVSIPNFVLAPVLISVFALKLHMLPVAGWGAPDYLVLPAIVLAARPAALIARMTRSSMLEIMKQEYIRAARARGISNARIIFVHALKNAFLPVLTSAGVSFGYLLSGSFVVETVFHIPGVGEASFASIGQRDYSLIQGTTVLLATVFVTINLVIDLLYAFIDPRIRIGAQEPA